MTTDPHANTRGYYANYPAAMTKSEVDSMIEVMLAQGAEIARSNEPVARPEYTFDWDESLIPDPTSNAKGNTDDERWSTMDELLEPLGIVECYQRWCDKSKIATKRGTGKQLWASCPFPYHADRDPSCHINPEEGDNGGQWFCFPCGRGGDKYALVAAALDFDIDAMHTKGDPTFYNVRKRMAEDLGWSEAEYDPKGNSLLRRDPLQGASPESSPPTEEEQSPPAEAQVAPAGDTFTDVLVWRDLVSVGTPLHEWMRATEVTDIPDEFLLFLGITALACASGRQTNIHASPRIYPAIYTLLLGTSGSGKSRAVRLFEELIAESMPYEYDNPRADGVYLAGEPGSGEAIISAYARVIDGAGEEGAPAVTSNVRALWKIDELASFIGRAGRAGSTMETQLMSLYDVPPRIVHRLAARTLIGEAPFACFVSTTQPQAIGQFVTKQQVWSGFLNRWMPVRGTPKEEQVVDQQVADLSVPIMAFNTLWKHHRRASSTYDMTPEAKQLWKSFHREYVRPLKMSDDGMTNIVFARVDLLMRKMMLLFAVNESSTVITEDIAFRVCSMFNYIKDCYLHLAGKVVLSQADDCGDRMIEVLRSHGRPMPKGEFDHIHGKWRSYERQQRVRAFNELIGTGTIAIADGPRNTKGGPRGKVVYLIGETEPEYFSAES